MRVELTLDRFEGGLAVLRSDETEIKVPQFFLPKEAKEGELVVLSTNTIEGERHQRELKAKEFLNEILRGE